MTENTMPKALRLAAMLRSGMAMIPEIDLPESADELERLHAVEQEAERLRAENEALKKQVQEDGERLLYATKEYDGFEHVPADKYGYATECAKEAGREEPTRQDEIGGVRRLLDAALQSTKEQP